MKCNLAAATLALLVGAPPASGNEAFFLVAEISPPLEQGYILRVTKPEDIEHARFLAKNVPTGERKLDRMVVGARIAKGADGLNRNYCAPGAPRWSWHITDFAFVDYTIEILDGSPAGVEANVDHWIETKHSHIGFWGYSVVAELDPLPLVVWNRVTESGAHLSWMALGTNYVYTVETSSKFDSPEWAPAEGQTWPIAGTNWVDTSFSPQSAPRMYRVRAEKDE